MQEKTKTFTWADETYTAVYGNYDEHLSYVKVVAPGDTELFLLQGVGQPPVDCLRLCMTAYASGHARGEDGKSRGF